MTGGSAFGQWVSSMISNLLSSGAAVVCPQCGPGAPGGAMLVGQGNPGSTLGPVWVPGGCVSDSTGGASSCVGPSWMTQQQLADSGPNNPYVTAATDVAGLVAPFAGKTGKVLGPVASGVSLANDQSPPNVVVNVFPLFVEGAGWPLAFVGAEADLLGWLAQTVGNQMINTIPGNTIDNGNGYAMPNPATMSDCDLVGGCH